ncbi:hypothetical protein PHLGIDRAFT_17374 [Phlebiopsis gigantea 11061_1 CR5-6]|uniref:Homeobox domain-containing protein n=1 Tax=Phlebiopsis gigantea (strain 11061_1 CR5-6) TaxID=745531 RepID=A0A0C3RYE6_PHLG1|nr:hypothetical protein PHLGIDRAFT_17374 [Phlebiopsis gigantea 11061_1 CR5-6]
MPAPPSLSSNTLSESRSGGGLEDSTIRRTRIRFTHNQLAMLESLYHQTSHPTPQQREALAKDALTGVRNVTTWFQNKRQAMRKLTSRYGSTSSCDHTIPSSFVPQDLPLPYIASLRSTRVSASQPRRTIPSSVPRRLPIPYISSLRLTISPASEPTPPATVVCDSRTIHPYRHYHAHQAHQQLAVSRWPSLDQVATRAERRRSRYDARVQTLARTHSKCHDHKSKPRRPAINDFENNIRRHSSCSALELVCSTTVGVPDHDCGERDKNLSDGDGEYTEHSEIGSELETESGWVAASTQIGDVGLLGHGMAQKPKQPMSVNKLKARSTVSVDEPSMSIDKDIMSAALSLCDLGRLEHINIRFQHAEGLDLSKALPLDLWMRAGGGFNELQSVEPEPRLLPQMDVRENLRSGRSGA